MIQRFVAILLLAGACLGQTPGTKEIKVAPEVLSRYVGIYAMSPTVNLTITLVDGQLVSQMTGQGKVGLSPKSDTMFTPQGINAEIDFPKDEKGPASQLILHQNGRDVTMKRLNDAAAKKVADAAAAFDKRYKDQTPAPGSEAAVRRMIVELQAGTPNYDLMSPGLADATRQQLTGIQSMLNGMGPLQSVIFKGVGPGGADIYQVNFEKASIDYRVWLSADGKVDSANMRPSDSPAPIVAVTAESLKPQIEKIDSMIAADVARNPIGSVTVGIVSGKQLIWTKSYGDADMEKKIPADADTVYRIGSITKMFTALMLEQLVETGKVHLSDPVEKYFPEIKQVKGAFPDAPPITLIQLATHTSGLGREPDDVAIATAGPVAEWEKTLIAALPHLKYDFEPGTRFSYSNIGYAILGAALSRAAGEAYVEYVPKHIFAPLGMTHSAMEWNAQMATHLAKGYQAMGPGKVDSDTPERENKNGRGYKVPNGAIYTSVSDLARFASFEMCQGPDAALKKSSLDRFQRQTIVPADIGLTSGYGIGFQVDRRDGYVAFGHSGAVAGYTSALLMNRAKGIGVIVFSNGSANPDGIANQALDILSK
jgi:CubicO group peptidase (beta-lactamase class C family)